MLTIFWIFSGFAFWCFLGYPLVMLVRAHFWPVPLRDEIEVGTPSISIIVAVRNGAGLLERRIENLLAQEYPADRFEVLIVCNGCTDESERIAGRLAAGDARIQNLVSNAGEGKAGALNLAARRARGEYLIFADLRQSFAPDVVERLLEPFADPQVGVVGGGLLIEGQGSSSVEGVRSYWKLESLLRRAESRTGSVIGVSGAIYALRRELFQPLPTGLILDDVLVPMRVALAGRRVVLQESAIAYDRPSASQEMEYRRKVRTLAGNLELLRVCPELLHPSKNPVFLRFLSHKVLRLLAPLLFLGILASAGFLAGPLYTLSFWGGLAIYALGVLGLLLPLPGLSLPAAFVMIHFAIFSAFLRSREHSSSLWSTGSSEPDRTARLAGAAPMERE